MPDKLTKEELKEVRELYRGWMIYGSMAYGGGKEAKSDDGETARLFMMWVADNFEYCLSELERLEQVEDENKKMRELLTLLVQDSLKLYRGKDGLGIKCSYCWRKIQGETIKHSVGCPIGEAEDFLQGSIPKAQSFLAGE